ncbi:leucyl/phenylalanyl-tRNA--protein transferase [Amylibacter cionae]|uniref:Leucyl/phenylalanyl-tRNA--protein transferase n=1 Tax=Neptunicoccus cionae TaxID=2035344 RepID=A0A916VNC5_9RHOB|nr:leucyl/phenylalanyl-tRNA--protein transferase [Amylibacter cionae]
MSDVTPELLVRAYASGVFPMADTAASTEIYWVDPTERGIVPLDGFHISRSLAKAIRREDYSVRINSDFALTLEHCADRPETWINGEIFQLYCALYDMGLAHSLEVWRDDKMIGGVYGVTLGGAFFGESMFSKATNGSKIALSYLVHRLRTGGFSLFDTQFITSHLQSLGAIEIPREAYHQQLAEALRIRADFTAPVTPDAGRLLADLKPKYYG